VTVTGLIRACVKNPDGTSNLILQGVERVRITGWRTGEPYRVAETVPFLAREEASPAAVAKAAELVSAVRRTLDSGPAGLNEEFLAYLGTVQDDPATLVDLVSAQLIGDLRARLATLGSPSVTERIEIALAALDDGAGDATKPGDL
jgi:Lon protease-like protein